MLFFVFSVIVVFYPTRREKSPVYHRYFPQEIALSEALSRVGQTWGALELEL